jgi:predicted type IV restriction endonuclease
LIQQVDKLKEANEKITKFYNDKKDDALVLEKKLALAEEDKERLEEALKDIQSDKIKNLTEEVERLRDVQESYKNLESAIISAGFAN